MRAILLLLVTLALLGCNESGFEAAGRQYDLQKANGASESELCAAARKVAAAAVDEDRPTDYKLWDVTGDLHCGSGSSVTPEIEAAVDKMEADATRE